MSIIGILAGVSSACYLLLFSLFTYGWCRKKAGSGAGHKSSEEKVSIIVSAKNEELSVGDLLDDLALQEYPAGLAEIIVVDDHSTDNTATVVRDFITGRGRTGITLMSNKDHGGAGKKDALSLGIACSKGDIILTTDADCRVGPGWVSALVDCFYEGKTRMVFGPVDYLKEDSFSDKFQVMEFSGLVASGAGSALAGFPFMCNGANLAYRKKAFETVGGFDGNEHYLSGDDVFLLHKIKKRFGRRSVVFCMDKESMVRTCPEPGWVSFLRQRIRWASKSRGYKDGLSLFAAFTVFLFNLSIPVLFFAGFWDKKIFIIAGLLYFFKMLADLPLMLAFSKFTGKRGIMKWYVPFQVIYPFYIVAAGIGSLFKKKKW